MEVADAPLTAAARARMRSPLGQAVLSFAAGLVFGIGLIVSGLTDPTKVLAFLDVAGEWNPTLLFAMATASAAGLAAFGIASRRSRTLIGLPLPAPAPRTIDRRLVLGSVLFGLGWGLAGICPGPAFVAMSSGSVAGGLFAVAMLAGIASFDRVAGHPAATPQPEIHLVRHTTQ